MRDEADLVQTLEQSLGGQVTCLRLLAGGAVRDNWFFEWRDSPRAEPERCVVRLAPESACWGPALPLSSDAVGEARVLQTAARAGIAVPRFRRLFQGALGQKCLVMDFVPGTTDVTTILALAPAQRQSVLCDLVQMLLRLQAVPLDSFVVPVGATRRFLAQGFSPVRAWVLAFLADCFATLVNLKQDTAFLSLCQAWMMAQLSVVEEQSWSVGMNRLCPSHGDFRVGNILVEGGRSCTLLDWEFAELAPPAVDLGWFCAPVWCYGGEPAGGLGSLELLRDCYGCDIEGLTFWQVVALVKWWVIAQAQGARFFDRGSRDPDLGLTGLIRPFEAAEWILDLMYRDPVAGGEPPNPVQLLGRLRHQLAVLKTRPGSQVQISRIAQMTARLDRAVLPQLTGPPLCRFRRLNHWVLSLVSPHALGAVHCQLVNGDPTRKNPYRAESTGVEPGRPHSAQEPS